MPGRQFLNFRFIELVEFHIQGEPASEQLNSGQPLWLVDLCLFQTQLGPSRSAFTVIFSVCLDPLKEKFSRSSFCRRALYLF